MSATFSCKCGGSHGFDEVAVEEQLARAVDHDNNSNKYWRWVHVSPPCGNERWLTHSGRWTNGWRDGGAWKLSTRQHAMSQYTSKVRGQYHHVDAYGDHVTGPLPTQLAALEDCTSAEKRRANQNAYAAQSFTTVLSKADLLQGVATPVADPAKPAPARNGVDPLIKLGQRTDTLVTNLATSELTPELATERALLITELESYRERLEQVESTLEVATMLMSSKT